MELYLSLSAGDTNLGPCLLYKPSDDSRHAKLRGCEGRTKIMQKGLLICWLLF